MKKICRGRIQGTEINCVDDVSNFISLFVWNWKILKSCKEYCTTFDNLYWQYRTASVLLFCLTLVLFLVERFLWCFFKKKLLLFKFYGHLLQLNIGLNTQTVTITRLLFRYQQIWEPDIWLSALELRSWYKSSFSCLLREYQIN